MSDSEPDKPVTKKEKKKATEQQLANLKKGMEIMKSKREALAKERDEHVKKQEAGEIPADAPAPKFVPKPVVKKVSAVKEEKQVIVVPRKVRGPSKTDTELSLLRAEISALKKPTEVVEKVVEKIVPVEKVVEKTVERVVTGSALLDAVFKFK